jgi:uncharacterized protein YqgV (UPF0045/DUF77 family)
MNKKDLEKLGLTADVLEKAGLKPELLEQIIVEHGKDIEAHKTKVTTLETERDGLKTQLGEANTTIEGFKKMDVAGVQKAADEWKTKAEQAQADATKQISGLKFDHALDAALTAAKARNATAVKALLKTQDLKLNEAGEIVGLNEQLTKVKTENDFLFEVDAAGDEGDKPKTPKIIAGTKSGIQIGDAVINAARKSAGLPPAGE